LESPRKETLNFPKGALDGYASKVEKGAYVQQKDVYECKVGNERERKRERERERRR
jgi:hypothetical protein